MNKDKQESRNDLMWLMNQPISTKAAILNHHLSLVQLFVNHVLEEEVKALTGEKYAHNDMKYDRYGYNPGSVYSGEGKVRIEVPRVIDKETKKFKPLETYHTMRQNEPDHEAVAQAVLKGLSVRDYASIADYLGESFGLSKSKVSNHFVECSKEKLREFEERSLEDDQIIAIFIDGKYMFGAQMIIALGITELGVKKPLGILQTSSENGIAIGQFLKSLIHRGLKYQEGLLFIIDGSKGIYAAIKETFGNKALIQRCIWHKRENIMSYLAEKEKDWVRSEYHEAIQQTTYEQAKKSLDILHLKLQKINKQAAASLMEGQEELLTLHKLKVNTEFSVSFSTTNCIESVNSQLKKYIGKVKNWSSSDQRYRWVASALLIIETKTRRVDNFKQLYKLKEKIATFVIANP